MGWKEFEVNVTKYLNDNIGFPGISFINSGGENSNEPDIKVIFNGKNIFSIELKKSKSQSSQFVVINNKNSFIYSEQNRTDPISTEEIIDHMNNNHHYYQSNVEPININLKCDKHLMFDRVINHLKVKSKLIISSDYDDDFNASKPLSVFHIDEIKQHFIIDGKYRTKRSGSSPARKNDLGFIINETIEKDDRFYLEDPNNLRERYLGTDNFLVLSKKPDQSGLREIRKRGKTMNANVIFTLELKQDSKKHSDLEIIRQLIYQLI